MSDKPTKLEWGLMLALLVICVFALVMLVSP